MKALKGNFPRKFTSKFPKKTVHFLGDFLESLLEVHICTLSKRPSKFPRKFRMKWTDFLGNFTRNLPRRIAFQGFHNYISLRLYEN